MNIQSTRRGFFGAGAAALTALQAEFQSTAQAAENHGFKLGVATYSLRKFSRAKAIEMLKQLRVTDVSIKSFHLPYEDTPEQLKAAMAEFKAAGITAWSAGNNSIQKDDEADIRRYFEYAKNAGIPMLVIAPTAQTLPKIEKFVKEYDIKVAIHNHGPEDKHFPTPQSALKLVKNMDPRVGLCIDVGHTARTGVDVVESIREAGPRLLDMHVKDLADMKERDSQCDVGEGKMPIVAIFRQLKKMNYRGGVMLEYEIHADAPLLGMAKSLSYMRGVLAAMSA